MTVEGALATPDGAWRVEIVKHARNRWYRIVHGDNEIDWLSIAAVERILGEAGVDMARAGRRSEQPPAPPATVPPDRCAAAKPEDGSPRSRTRTDAQPKLIRGDKTVGDLSGACSWRP